MLKGQEYSFPWVGGTSCSINHRVFCQTVLYTELLLISLVCWLELAESDSEGCNHVYSISGVKAPQSSFVHFEDSGRYQCSYLITAPVDHIIVVNLTIHGFDKASQPDKTPTGSELQENSQGNYCKGFVPKLDIIDRPGMESERTLRTICHKWQPLVFHSESQFLKIIYVWDKSHEKPELKVIYKFQKRENCAHKCADQSCLHGKHLVCNGMSDCPDSSDENECPVINTPNFSEALTYIVIVVVVAALAAVISIIGCWFFCHHMSWRTIQQHPHQGSDCCKHCHLVSRASSSLLNSAEVTYVPTNMNNSTTSQEFYRREMEHERQIRLQAIQRDMDLNLPPSIPISEDGEEGYINSQRRLHNTNSEIDRESVRPPPNRTIFDGESPPPYRSHSVSTQDKKKGKVPSRIVRDNNGSAVVKRCYSMSNNSTDLTFQSRSPSQQRHYSHPPHQSHVMGNVHNSRTRRCYSAGHSRHGSSSDSSTGSGMHSPGLGPPPDYSEVVDVFHKPESSV